MGAAFMLASPAQVKVTLGKLSIPVYEEGLPDENPPFDAFATGSRYNYPYTLRTTLTGRRLTRDLRAVYLENEYLKCSVLPDIGGHLYSCTDKISGREMFYANPSLKKQLIGYRGAWAAFGIEFNFPVSHNWMSMSPVDFAYRENQDGSGSVFVGNIDRPYGMEWRVELVLRPGSTVLEEKVTLYNRGDMRRRYYWWNNAAAEVRDDSKIYYPMRFSASHGFTFVDTWPVNHDGMDVSVVKNQKAGPVSQFVHGSREPFMGVWHPRWNTGVVHYAEYAPLPGKKIWSWGVDPDGLDWRKALSDNNSAYVEIQAGLFRNQETYAFLPPQSTIQFSEYWMPVREIGGISRANLNGVVFMRREGSKLKVGLNVNRPVQDAHIRVVDGSHALLDVREGLDPAKTFSRDIDGAPADRRCTFEVRDSAGTVLLAHTEDTYDWTPASEIHTGPQTERHDIKDVLETGTDQEVNGALLDAKETYRRALEKDPANYELNKAAGRLAVTLKDFDAGLKHLRLCEEQVSNDPEVQYYLGHAYLGVDDPRYARAAFETALRQPQFRVAARLELAQLDASEGRRADALALVRAAIAEQPGMVRAGALEVALLRVAGQESAARETVREWLREYPSENWLRVENVKLGATDASLWRHLGSDPERVLLIATGYMKLGMYQDALDLVARRYPDHDTDEAEPGTPLPQDDPIVLYYRGFCREKLRQPADEDYRAASRLSTCYVFPYRAQTLAVLKRAVAHDPNDATAHYLLGDVVMSAGMTDAAIAEWRKAQTLNSKIPVLHRNLGGTLFALKHDDRAAIEVFREGLTVDPDNTELYTGLTAALSILRQPAEERVRVLEKYPDRAKMPSPLALDLALSYAEAGRFAEATAMFRNRHFEKQEGGTDVRQVYIETELLHALSLQGADSRRAVGNLGKPVQDLDFTHDGMEAFLHSPHVEYYVGVIEKRAGDEAAARAHWETAASGHGIFAALAARELGSEWKDRALRIASTGREASAERGLALVALGRNEEAKRILDECLRAPDRNMQHYLARRGLQ